MPTISLAGIGPTTTSVETAATTIGACILLGGFAMGVIGLAEGWSRRDVESRALRDGYIGGLVGAVLLIADITFRYAF